MTIYSMKGIQGEEHFVRFSSGEERKNHPQGYLINAYLMESLFENQLSALEINVLKEGVKALQMQALEGFSKKQSLKVLICLFLSDKKINTLEIIDFAIQELQLCKKDIAYHAALCGVLRVVSQLKKELDVEWVFRSHDVYRSVISQGKPQELEVILQFNVNPEIKVKDLLLSADYQCFLSFACEFGHLDVFKYLEEKLESIQIQKAIREDNYFAYFLAFRDGYLDVIKYLEKKLEIDEVKAISYFFYRYIGLSGHLDVIHHLEENLETSAILKAFKENDYFVYRFACSGGHLDVIKHLEEKLNEWEIRNAINAKFYDAFRSACNNKHLDVIKHLLNKADCFSYADREEENYVKKITSSFVSHKLNLLKKEKTLFENSNPKGIFNINSQDVHYYILILRNLIRRGVDRDYEKAEELGNDIRFLLNIPGIKECCHEPVVYLKNELLRFAIKIGNQEAAVILLQVPEVHRIAEQNDFYLDEAEGDIDLRSLAKNSGSSMVAVSISEKDNQLKHCSSASKNQFGLFQSSVKNSGDLNSSLKSSIKNLT